VTEPHRALDVIARLRVIPVVVLDDADDAPPLASALAAGGLPLAEVTLRTPAALAAISALAADARLVVGAGTVLTPRQVDDAVAAGAQFVVSPGFSPAVVARAAHAGVPVLPGVATATEVMAALDAGVSVVKFFPAAVCGGPAAVTALAAPFPTVHFVPTGGITAQNLPAYLVTPGVLAVGGSWMVARDLLRTGRFDDVARLAAEAVSASAAASAGRDR
jgi:2-dehydro-3-deoxyphosphogluconate aldolase / (4S)-4-hydroxy-2-oxoglutarate aldolase